MSDFKKNLPKYGIDDVKLAAWEAGKQGIEQLNFSGAEKYLKKEFPDLNHAFLSNFECVVCMDEGTAHKDVGGEAKFCMAGSGILYPAKDEAERVQKVAALFLRLGIKNVTSHGGCGAAGLAYKRDFPNSTPTPEEIEKYGQDWVKKVAEEMERHGEDARCQNIAAGDMERPPEFHTARVVYWDGIGGFNPNKEIGLPMGFVIERKFVPAGYAAEELKVAVNIAFGHHGFGKLFSKECPFVIILMAGSTEELDNLKKEVENVLRDLEPYREGKVKVDGFIIG